MGNIRVHIRDKEYLVEKGITLSELGEMVQEEYKYPVVVAKVNNQLRPLQLQLFEDAKVEFLDLSTSIGHRILERSLVFLLAKVVREFYPLATLSAEHSISNGLYCLLQGQSRIKKEDVERMENRMKELIRQDLPIERETVDKKEAIELFTSMNNLVRARLFENNRSKKTTSIYKLEEYQDYMYGYIVPRTGVLKHFSLRYYMPGFLLLLTKKDNPNRLPPFREQPKLFNILRDSERFSQIQGVSDAGTLNQCIRSGETDELVRIAEGMHEKKIMAIADQITCDRERLKLIMIAGPSSSGKTTFAKRLSVQLMVNGIEPVSISLDDYFVKRQETPIDEFGEVDYESIHAIRLDQFNDDLTSLIQGEEVTLPLFDFKKGTYSEGKKLKIRADQPIIIEGIHAINNVLTKAIPRSRKFFIYISALTQLNLDCSNRIKTTDARLMRRMVRDARVRGISPEDTLARWSSVRRGEDQNIFPYQENADVMFNSHLIYELAVLKPLVEKLLCGLDSSSPYFAEAVNLLNIVDFFEPIEDTGAIPNNSIIREFIGDSVFYDR
ncbi:nucleoside kinase [Clostridia bacterium]|nr:nucleoside kinase [Clostridia bacterium]